MKFCQFLLHVYDLRIWLNFKIFQNIYENILYDYYDLKRNLFENILLSLFFRYEVFDLPKNNFLVKSLI